MHLVHLLRALLYLHYELLRVALLDAYRLKHSEIDKLGKDQRLLQCPLHSLPILCEVREGPAGLRSVVEESAGTDLRV